MSSALATDPRAPVRTTRQPADLLVLWRHPETGEISPVGRLAHHGTDFQFTYTVAASEIEGFRPLPGLPQLDRLYRSPEIPLVFGQRVLARTRPDYPDYVRALGLDPERATPWEQIVHSGGSREGDTLQFMAIPEVRAGRARAEFLGNGVRWITHHGLRVGGAVRRVTATDQERALRSLAPGDVLAVRFEDGNPRDSHACLLVTDGTPVAWIPRVLSQSVRELLRDGDRAVRVVRLGDPDGPPHLRLTLALDTEAPAGFSFDRAGRWEPLARP